MNKTCNKYLWFYQKYFNVWSYDRPIRGRKSILKIRNVPERENICDCCAYKSLGIPILKKGFLLFHSLWISPLSKRCPLRRSLDKRASITRVFYPLIKIYDHHRPPDIFRCVSPPSLFHSSSRIVLNPASSSGALRRHARTWHRYNFFRKLEFPRFFHAARILFIRLFIYISRGRFRILFAICSRRGEVV